MGLTRDMLRTVISRHTVRQKANYLKYLLSNKKEVLGYDPVTLSIVATTRCTLSCKMCPTHSALVGAEYPHRQHSVKDMSMDIFKDIIDRFSNATTVHIIGSGEPLLNKDFFAMVDYASSRKMKVKTFSNGTTIPENIDKILSSKLDGITVSINGHDPREFMRMTGMDGAVYVKVHESVRQLVAQRDATGSKVKIKLSFILDNQNYRHIPEMIETARRLGVDHSFFCNFLPAPYDGLKAEERSLMAGSVLAAELSSLFSCCPEDYREKITLPPLIDTKQPKNRCSTHFSQIRFDGDGNVSSCSMMLLNMTGNGNFRDNDVWNNVYFKRMRNVFLSGESGLLDDPCKVCPDNKGKKIRE